MGGLAPATAGLAASLAAFLLAAAVSGRRAPR
jgi:hypothetical protein